MLESCPRCQRPFTTANEQTDSGACELCEDAEYEAIHGHDKRSQPRELDKNSYCPTADEIRAEAEKIREGWSEYEEMRRRGVDPHKHLIAETAVNLARWNPDRY